MEEVSGCFKEQGVLSGREMRKHFHVQFLLAIST